MLMALSSRNTLRAFYASPFKLPPFSPLLLCLHATCHRYCTSRCRLNFYGHLPRISFDAIFVSRPRTTSRAYTSTSFRREKKRRRYATPRTTYINILLRGIKSRSTFHQRRPRAADDVRDADALLLITCLRVCRVLPTRHGKF